MSNINSISIPSQSALEYFEGDIYFLSTRLSRCIAEVLVVGEDSFKPPPFACSQKPLFIHLRRLGVLLRAAKSLVVKIKHADEQRYNHCNNNSGCGAFSRSYSTKDGEDTIKIRTYRAELKKAYSTFLDASVRAEKLLEEKLSLFAFPLPANCVGEVPFVHKEIVSAFSNPKSSHSTNNYYVLPNLCEARYSIEELPCERVSFTSMKVDSHMKDASLSKKAVHGGHTKLISKSSTVEKAFSTEKEKEETPEEAVMRDIRMAIQQVKNGALQVRHLMNEEAHVLSTSEALLSDGIGKSHKNIQDINKINEVKDASEGNMFRLVSRIPGGAILWRSIIIPLWVLIRQVLLFSIVLSVVFMTMVLIMSVRKPRVYRGVRRQPSVSSYTAPKLSIKKEADSLKTNHTAIVGAIEELFSSHDL